MINKNQLSCITGLFAALLILICCQNLHAQLNVSANSNGVTLATQLVGNGATVSNVSIVCPGQSSGIFSNGNSTNLGLNQGIVLTSGSAPQIPGLASTNLSINNNAAGDADLDVFVAPETTFDACKLEFDFEPIGNSMSFQYVFGSEEYPVYACSTYNDAFAFLLTGPNPMGGDYVKENIALIPNTNTPVSINNVANIPPDCVVNPAYYVDNTNVTTIKYNAFTTVLTAQAEVVPCSTYHMKLVIGDVFDRLYDTGVFLKSGSFNVQIACENVTVELDNDGVATLDPADLYSSSNSSCILPTSYTATQTNFDCSDLGPNTVTLNVVVQGGQNTSCQATVTVVDNQNPIAQCQAISVSPNVDGTYTIDPALVNDGSADNCDFTLSVSPASFPCAHDTPQQMVTLNVTDAGGNTASCQATVTLLGDNDLDGIGDICDPDDDNDGIADEDEITCGSNPFNAASTCEVCDGIDNDLDELVDEGFTDTDGDFIADCVDTDDDNDGIPDEEEIACGSDPLNAASTCEVCDGIDNDLDELVDEGFPDTDGDFKADCIDPDDDGDGITDEDEIACGSDPLNAASTCEICDGIDNDLDELVDEGFTDTDGDFIADCVDPDDDNDGISDEDEIACGSDPLNVNSTCEICDGIDNDLDELVDEGFVDTDGDGMADCVDPDDDNDGVVDEDDSDPLNNFICQDLDGDGCDDCSLGYVNPADDGPDFDGDGLCDSGDPDDDNDGISDEDEIACGSDPFNHLSTCEICDGLDNDQDGSIDEGFIDTDSDGMADCVDPDDDNDGISDEDEIACGSNPLNSASTCEICDGIDNDLDELVDEGFTDTDGDFIADCVDPDDDNDGISDEDEIACGSDPLNFNSTCEVCDGIDNDLDGDVDEGFTNTDGDSMADCVDPDDDNDGISDEDEIACGSDPLNFNSTCEVCDGIDNDLDGDVDEGFTNTDGDSMADCVDPDDDNDGISDEDEIACGSNPLNSASTCEVCDGIDNDLDELVDEGFTDTDGDFIADCVDPDDDNDGISDEDEIACGSNPLNSASTCEICDGIDNDLDGDVDEGFTNTDGDSMADCVDPDDDNDGISDEDEIACGSDPLNINSTCEVCDGIDNDLDGDIDEDFTDTDGDGMANCVDPDDDNDGNTDEEEMACGSDPLDPNSNCEICDGIDNDHDGIADEGFTNTDGDSMADCVDPDDDNDGISDEDEIACGSDPLDVNSTCEICDGFDNDLDGDVDEGFADNDGDNLADCVDPDDDNDGCLDIDDDNPTTYSNDSDCDGIHDDCDVCPGGDDNGPCNATELPPLQTLPPYWLCPNNGNNEKIRVCHDGTTLCVSVSAAETHLAHGDFLGPCVSCTQNIGNVPSGNSITAAEEYAPDFKLFPNPATASVIVQLEHMESAGTLVLYNMFGRKVLAMSVEEGTRLIELNLRDQHIATGQYSVRLVMLDGTTLSKLLVVNK